MKRFLSTTAVLLTLSGTAYAEGHGTGFGGAQVASSDFIASDLIGMRIYNSETEISDTTALPSGSKTEWDDLGEVNDLLISENGKMKAVILGIGGFLGVGERDVAVSMDSIKVVREEGAGGDRFLVVTASQEILENAPEFEQMTDDTMGKNAVEATETADEQAADVAEEATDATETAASELATQTALERPNVAREGYAEAEAEMVDKLTAEDLEGSYVYGANDETVGEIGSLIMSDSGKISQVIVNVGGFLGIGEKPVAVSFEELQVLRNTDGEDVRIYIDSTEEKLEAMPEYEG